MKSFLLWRGTDAIQSIRVPTAAAQQEHDTLLFITNGNSCTQKERRKAVVNSVSYTRLWNAHQQRHSDTTLPRYSVAKSSHVILC